MNGAKQMTLKRWEFAAFALVCVTACNGSAGDAKALTSTCTDQGERPETCACVVTAMQSKLPDELFARTADAVGRQKRDVESFVRNLPEADQIAFAIVANDLLACGESGAAPGPN